ncbi:MAG: endo alpha-1,4 polygalactosaminidase, partial [Actinomycetota bacterium]
KNALDEVPALVDAFDFAVNEQCFEYDECDALRPFLARGKPVFSAEYAEELRDNHDDLCADARDRGLRTLILPRDLDDSFRISCDEPPPA